MYRNASSPIVRLNIGGYEFITTVDTLTNREPMSMLAAMFRGRYTVNYTVNKDREKEYVFIDRDGMHFRHILNWLRDGVTSNLSDVECSELLREAEYYELFDLVEVLNKKKDEQMDTDLTRTDIVKSIQSTSTHVKLRGVNLSGLDLSRLDLSDVELSYACLKNVSFSGADLRGARFVGANLQSANLQGANLRGAHFDGANLSSANLQDASLIECNFYGADLQSAQLQTANLTDANLEKANLEGANLKGANLKGANLQLAVLHLAKNLDGAGLLSAII